MRKSLATAAVVAASVLGGGAVGAALFTPGVGLAQEEAPETTVPEGEAQSPPEGECGPGHRGPRGAGLDVAADALGIEAEALHEALRSGQSMADVAAEQGVDVQTVIDAIVADKAARLDAAVDEGRLTAEEAEEKKAELEERVTARVNGERPERPEGTEGRRGPGGPPEDAPEDTPQDEGEAQPSALFI